MFSLFARAQAGLNLNPAERAFLKLVEGFFVAGGVAVLPLVSQLLASQSIDWPSEIRVIIGTFAVAVLMAAVKYVKAQNDDPLVVAFSAVADKVSAATGLNDVKTPATPLPAAPAPAAATAPVTPAAAG